MVATTELNMVGVLSPVCLLKCKDALRTMPPGQVVVVTLEDPEVVDALVTIIGRSADAIVRMDRQGDRYRVAIRKDGKFQGPKGSGVQGFEGSRVRAKILDDKDSGS